MGTSQCQQCEPERLSIDFASYSPYQSIGQIEQKYRAYAQSNMLGFYSVRMQKNIERLYTLGQLHICDLIIRLTCEKRTEVRDNLLEEVERIDLEKLDHLSLIEILPKNVQSKYTATSSIFFQEEDAPEQTSSNETTMRKSEKSSNHQYGLRILNKYALKNKLKKREQPFKNNYFFVVGTVGCFESQNVLVASTLPTKKSPLRIFLEKIEGSSIKNRTNILAVFIVSPQSQSDFDKEVDAYHQELKEDYYDSDVFDPPYIKIQKVLYKSIYPCVNSDRKIQLTPEGNRILFNHKDGDLIGFMVQEPVFEGLLQKYEFVQIANISNILEPIADKQALGYLTEHTEADIVAPVVVEETVKGRGETLKLNKYFVERITINSTGPIQKHYQLTEGYYLRTMLLTNKGSHFQKLISTRIKSKPLPGLPDAIYFYRTFEHVLYSPITLLLVTTKKTFSLPGNQQRNYSNYCKSILGITDTKDEEIVEICPQILFGAKVQLEQIISKLRNLPSVGFPLVLNRQKLDSVRSTHQ